MYGAAKHQIEIKTDLIQKGYIKAIVSLPINWFSTIATINLLIISKQQHNSVLLINANGKEFAKYVVKEKGRDVSIKREGIDFIINIINKNEVMDGVSIISNINEIIQQKYNLMPTTYINEKVEEEQITVKEIDEELAELYKKLGVKI